MYSLYGFGIVTDLKVVSNINKAQLGSVNQCQ